jgi:serine/threonine protein kinase
MCVKHPVFVCCGCLLLQLGDAGMARLLPDSGATARTGNIAGGTAGYIDPSYIANGTFGPKSDVYSLGEQADASALHWLARQRPPVICSSPSIAHKADL